MPRESYHIINPQNNQKIGVIFLNSNLAESSADYFESLAPTIQETAIPVKAVEKSSFWQSDGIRYSLAAGVVFSVALFWDWPGWLAAAATIGAGFGLHALKIYLNRAPQPQPISDKAEAETVIKVESWSEDNAHVEIDYIEDDTIKPDELSRVAAAVCENNMEWLGRNKMCKLANLSQPKYGKIRDEFIRLNYVHNGVGNTTVLGLRGKSFLRQLASLPSQLN